MEMPDITTTFQMNNIRLNVTVLVGNHLSAVLQIRQP